MNTLDNKYELSGFLSDMHEFNMAFFSQGISRA